MSEFLKNLSDALANKVYIESPIFEFAKNGQSMKHENIITSLKQFVCTPYETNDSPAILQTNHWNEPAKEFGIENIQLLVKIISDWSIKIRFVPLIIPYGVDKAEIHRHKNIIGRYIEDYLPGSDEMGKRWDFLVQKLD